MQSKILMVSLAFFSAVCTGAGASSVEAAPSGPPSSHAPVMQGSDNASKPTYVRISRAFFEKTLQAEVKLTPQEGGDASSYQSPVSWVEYPPTAPAPSTDPKLGKVLADFRDFVACAEMPALGDSRLCFKVMADVSNLGLNDNEMSLQGIETITAAPSNSNACPASSATASDSKAGASAPASSPRYLVKKASTAADTLQLEFASSTGCGPKVELTLKQVP